MIYIYIYLYIIFFSLNSLFIVVLYYCSILALGFIGSSYTCPSLIVIVIFVLLSLVYTLAPWVK